MGGLYIYIYMYPTQNFIILWLAAHIYATRYHLPVTNDLLHKTKVCGWSIVIVCDITSGVNLCIILECFCIAVWEMPPALSRNFRMVPYILI